MRQHGSILMLAAQSTLWKVLLVTVVSCGVEAVLFLFTLRTWDFHLTPAYPDSFIALNPVSLEGLVQQSRLSWCFGVGLVLVCAVLAFLGWEGSSSRVSYTLGRLSVSDRAIVLWWSVYGGFCVLIYWAAHLGTVLLLCGIVLPQLSPESRNPQSLFLAFYRSSYLHSLLPLEDGLFWVRNLSIAAALGTSAANFSFQHRNGRRAFAVLPLSLSAALFFSLPMGSFCIGGPSEVFLPYLYTGYVKSNASVLTSIFAWSVLVGSLSVLVYSLIQIVVSKIQRPSNPK